MVSSLAIVYIQDPDAETALKFSRVRYLSYALLSAAVFGCGVFYTFIAPRQAGLEFQTVFALDGRDFMRRSAPEDIALIDWINHTLDRQTVILEAAGDSFSEYGRVAAFTGNPTIIQWPVHEWLWRGSFDQPLKPKSRLGPPHIDTVANRVEDVHKFYEAVHSTEAAGILKKYKVNYFVVGRKERQQYPKINAALMADLGDVVFSEGQVTLYKVKSDL